jgi:hypothetical protein
MLYEKLRPEMQETVDEFTERIADLPWAQKSDALAAAAWLTAHPEVATLVQTAMATDEPEGGPDSGPPGGETAA